MNTIAYSENIATVGGEGDEWRVKSVARLVAGESDKVVLPHYGADPRITKPVK